MKFMVTGKSDNDIALDEIFETDDTFQDFRTTRTCSVVCAGRGFSYFLIVVFFAGPVAYREGFDDT
jgi:hypothetical protein